MMYPCSAHRWIVTILLFFSSVIAVFSQSWNSRGIVEPYRDAKVSATVSGTVVAIRAEEGQFVRSGDVVVELDNALEALEVERRKLVFESTAELDAAARRTETLRLDYEGTKKLHEQTQSVSLDEVRKKELEYRLAEGEHQRLVVSEQREQLEWRFAEAQLQKKLITAPFDGVIVSRLLEAGEGCSPQQALFRIADTRKCRLVVHMEQAACARMKPGARVMLRINETGGPIAVAGTVEFVSPLVDASSGLREVKVLFDNTDGRIHPGVTGAVSTER